MKQLKITIMTTNKSGKIRIYLYVLLTIAGCVFACSSIIPNDYIKLVVVMGTLCVGLYGIIHGWIVRNVYHGHAVFALLTGGIFLFFAAAAVCLVKEKKFSRKV